MEKIIINCEATNSSQEKDSIERGLREEYLREKGPKEGYQRKKLSEEEFCGRI
jgi:hypothetical protein